MICIMTKPVALFNVSNEALAKVIGNESHSDVAFKLVENSNNKRIFINSTEL